MSRIRLRWADGHEEKRDEMPLGGDLLWIPIPDGRNRIFRSTGEMDEDGRDIYDEEPPDA